MNDVERLLRQDRVAGVPEPPDLRYTESAVRRRLGRAPGAAEVGRGRWAGPAGREAQPTVAATSTAWSPGEQSVSGLADWWMAAAAMALLVPLALVLPYIGLSPWWVVVLPAMLLPLTPLLLMKERERS